METILKDERSAEPARAPVQVPAPARNGRRPFLILGALVAAGVLGIAIHAALTAGREETDDAQVEADVVPVGPRVGGQLLGVAVVENQAVHRGDPILQVDPADYEARVAQAEAELATAQAQAAAAEAQERIVGASASGGLASAEAAVSGSTVSVANAESQVIAARAAVERARADAHKADSDLVRARQLGDASAIAQEALDHAEAAAEGARAALAQAGLAGAEEARRAAVSRVAEARGHLQQSSPVGAQIAAAHAAAELARAHVKSAEASLKLAGLQLSYTRVVAPEDGVVSKLGAHEGQIVQAGQPVVELVPSRTYVVANFKETQVGSMRPGQRARIRIDAFPGRVLEGRVESRSAGTGARFALVPPDNASGNFVKVIQRVPVRIVWTTPPDVPLAAGLSADVVVYLR